MKYEQDMLAWILTWTDPSAGPDGISPDDGGYPITERNGVTAEQQKQILEAMRPSDHNRERATREWQKHGVPGDSDEDRGGWPPAPKRLKMCREQAPGLAYRVMQDPDATLTWTPGGSKGPAAHILLSGGRGVLYDEMGLKSFRNNHQTPRQQAMGGGQQGRRKQRRNRA